MDDLRPYIAKDITNSIDIKFEKFVSSIKFYPYIVQKRCKPINQVLVKMKKSVALQNNLLKLL